MYPEESACFPGKKMYYCKNPRILGGAFLDQFGTNIEICDDEQTEYLQFPFMLFRLIYF